MKNLLSIKISIILAGFLFLPSTSYAGDLIQGVNSRGNGAIGSGAVRKSTQTHRQFKVRDRSTAEMRTRLPYHERRREVYRIELVDYTSDLIDWHVQNKIPGVVGGGYYSVGASGGSTFEGSNYDTSSLAYQKAYGYMSPQYRQWVYSQRAQAIAYQQAAYQQQVVSLPATAVAPQVRVADQQVHYPGAQVTGQSVFTRQPQEEVRAPTFLERVKASFSK